MTLRTVDTTMDAAPRAIITATIVNGGADDITALEAGLREQGAATFGIDADIGGEDVTSGIFGIAETLGPVHPLVLCHAHSTNAGILAETIESFDHHFAVNARASWLPLASSVVSASPPTW
jgi:hypothetical protein